MNGDDDDALCCPPLIPPDPVPDGVVVFDFGRWSTRYPEFLGVGSALAQEYFYDATIYLDNSPQSPVCDASVGGERERLLFLMTAHLAYLSGPIPGETTAGAGGGVGRVGNKSVGPVSVGYTLDGVPGTAAWFTQSPYGFAFWQATAVYRTWRYRAYAYPRPMPGWPYIYLSR